MCVCVRLCVFVCVFSSHFFCEAPCNCCVCILPHGKKAPFGCCLILPPPNPSPPTALTCRNCAAPGPPFHFFQFSLSVHYRQVASPAHVDEVHKIVHEYISEAPEIVVKAGKKVCVCVCTCVFACFFFS